MTDAQAAKWRGVARAVGYKSGLRDDDLDDAEAIGWTAAWQAFEKARAFGLKDPDRYAAAAAANAVKNYERDTKKARGEVTNHDRGE